MGRVIVYHAYYGCDTGCCGHIVRMDETEEFQFAHPFDGHLDPLAWAQALVAETYGQEHVADLAWDECEIIDD